MFDEHGHWYRTEITAITATTVDVLFLDYGNIESVRLDNQTFSALLSNIIPSDEVWDEATCARFEEITLEKEIMCKIIHVRDPYKIGLNLYLK